MAQKDFQVVNTENERQFRPRDEMLDHFDVMIRSALDIKDYREAARLAACAAAYERTLWRGR